jgi:MFS family permease
VAVASLLPAAFLSLYGGVVADQLPKRIALAGAYTGQALLCFAVPTLFDTTDVTVMFFLILAVNALGQVSAPTESSVLPLVASEEELASGASLINLAAAIGQGFATALFAPIMVKALGVEPAIYLAGVLLLFAASRVFDLPAGDREFRFRLPPLRVRLRAAVRWLVSHPAVGSMVVVSVLTATVNVVLVSLAPRYVEAVLHTDATNTAYVFAPGAAGVGLGLLAAPFAIGRVGERITALAGLAFAGTALFLFGLIDEVATVIDPVNPLQWLEGTGIEMNSLVRTAAILAVPLAFGVSLTATSVQTYINRRVPIAHQGRTFALQSALRNGAAIIPLLALGVAAAELGADTVLLISPLLLLAVGYTLVYASFRIAGLRAPGRLEVLESFWAEPEASSRGNRERRGPNVASK